VLFWDDDPFTRVSINSCRAAVELGRSEIDDSPYIASNGPLPPRLYPRWCKNAFEKSWTSPGALVRRVVALNRSGKSKLSDPAHTKAAAGRRYVFTT
jgi:hypothetical protein